jgi:hypothetical protein
MANEKRLIDANALSEKIGKMKYEITHNRGGYRYCNEDEKNEWDKLDGFDSLVCDAPTVDAVEVCRCKDCKHCKKYRNRLDPMLNHQLCVRMDKYAFGVDEDDFCSYGERRTE